MRSGRGVSSVLGPKTVSEMPALANTNSRLDRLLLPRDEASVDELALYLQTHEQEEHRHQGVVDPQMHGHRPQLVAQDGAGLRVEQMEIALGQRAVRNDHRQHSHDHENDPACRFTCQEVAKCRVWLELPVQHYSHLAVDSSSFSLPLLSGVESVGNSALRSLVAVR